MRWTRPAVVVGIAACAFHHGKAPGDGKDIDTPSNAVCQVGTTGGGSGSTGGTLAGTVGLSTGGGTFMNIRCAPGGLLVGLALDMSDQPVNGGDTISAHGLRIACADVVEDGSGGHTGTPTTADLTGFGGANFTPSTMTAVAPCPAGSVMTGMYVHGSYHMIYLLAARIVCTRFDQDGSAGSAYSIDIAGTGSDTMFPSGAECAPGQQVVRMYADVGAGLDSVELYCADTVCK
jgi:hypothetical protein